MNHIESRAVVVEDYLRNSRWLRVRTHWRSRQPRIRSLSTSQWQVSRVGPFVSILVYSPAVILPACVSNPPRLRHGHLEPCRPRLGRYALVRRSRRPRCPTCIGNAAFGANQPTPLSWADCCKTMSQQKSCLEPDGGQGTSFADKVEPLERWTSSCIELRALTHGNIEDDPVADICPQE
jgi:hypothetical protein